MTQRLAWRKESRLCGACEAKRLNKTARTDRTSIKRRSGISLEAGSLRPKLRIGWKTLKGTKTEERRLVCAWGTLGQMATCFRATLRAGSGRMGLYANRQEVAGA